jgi:hypothetical protein
MLHIELDKIKGATFNSPHDPKIVYTTVGYGQNPESGADYVVGVEWDQASNRTSIRTFLFKDVKFNGNVS